MGMYGDYANKNDVSFPQIILKQYERILEKASHEFTGGYYNSVFSGNNVEKNYISDARAEFNQSVKVLGLSLFADFDDKMAEKWKEFEEKEKEMTEKYSDDEGFIKSDSKGKFSIKSLNLSLELFKNLAALLKRRNYLRSTAYVEEIAAMQEEED